MYTLASVCFSIYRQIGIKIHQHCLQFQWFGVLGVLTIGLFVISAKCSVALVDLFDVIVDKLNVKFTSDI